MIWGILIAIAFLLGVVYIVFKYFTGGQQGPGA